MEKVKSKHELIKEHLLLGLKISGLEAWKLYGLYRLAVVIERLRKKGFNIITELVKEGNESYAVYRLG